MPRRRWLAALLACLAPPLAASGAAALVEVWVELSEPPPAAASGPAAQQQAARVARQQAAVALQLQRLGAIELARLRHTRDAIAVRIAADRLDAVRALPGVRHVRPTEGLHPRELMDPASAPRTQPR